MYLILHQAEVSQDAALQAHGAREDVQQTVGPDPQRNWEGRALNFRGKHSGSVLHSVAGILSPPYPFRTPKCKQNYIALLVQIPVSPLLLQTFTYYITS